MKRTQVVLQSRQSPVLIFQLHRLLRVLKLHYQVASSHLPTPQILRVLNLYYPVASSHLPAPRILRVLKLYYQVIVLPSHQFSSGYSPDTPRTKVVLPSHSTTKSPVLIWPLASYSAY